jgi:hypothetical protein
MAIFALTDFFDQYLSIGVWLWLLEKIHQVDKTGWKAFRWTMTPDIESHN